MSIPYRLVRCTRCGHAGNSTALVGLFIWRGTGGEQFFLDRQLGMCGRCLGVVAMEKFPEPEAFAAAQRRSRRGKLARLACQAIAWFDRDPFHTPLDRREGFRVLEEVMALGRRPVCLECGSTDVVPVPIPAGHSTRDRTVIPLALQHAGCGGPMTLQGSGLNRMAPVPKKRFYDISGRHLVTLLWE